MRNKRKQHKNKSHSCCQRWHAKRRLLERFGVYITTHEYRQIVKNIQENKYKKSEKQSQSRTKFFDVEIKGRLMDIIYDKHTQRIATVLYKEKINENKSIE